MRTTPVLNCIYKLQDCTTLFTKRITRNDTKVQMQFFYIIHANISEHQLLKERKQILSIIDIFCTNRNQILEPFYTGKFDFRPKATPLIRPIPPPNSYVL